MSHVSVQGFETILFARGAGAASVLNAEDRALRTCTGRAWRFLPSLGSIAEAGTKARRESAEECARNAAGARIWAVWSAGERRCSHAGSFAPSEQPGSRLLSCESASSLGRLAERTRSTPSRGMGVEQCGHISSREKRQRFAMSEFVGEGLDIKSAK